MQTYQKKPQVTPQANVQARAPLADTSAMNALRAGTAAPTPDMLGHKVDLPGALRARMESSFGADLSGVQLYESQTVADAGAEAITQGSHIAFAPGKLDFASTGGRALLGHEISHAVSQARGEVTGNGFLQSHALEARADHEGMLAAIGQPISAAPVGAISDVSAASAAGPMQAKKNKETPQGHQIDTEKMQFSRPAYLFDKDYRQLQGLIETYNASNENPAAEMALMNAAMAYINKNSTGEKAVHKGRTANAEDILYQLSMKGGTAAHADQNADALITAAQNPVGVDNLTNAEKDEHIADSTRLFSDLKGVYQPDSGYSPALQMIVAGVLADQNASGHAAAPTYQPTSTGSGASVSFGNGSAGFTGEHHYSVYSRVHGTTDNDALGTGLHELTHVANGEAYQNTSLLFSSEKGSNDVAGRRNERVKRLMALNQALPTAKTTQIADQKGGQQSLAAYHKDRLEYAAGDKVPTYAGQVPQGATHSIARAYAEKAFTDPKEQESFIDALGSVGNRSVAKSLQLLEFASADGNAQLDPQLGLPVPDDFREKLSPADRADAARDYHMVADSKQMVESIFDSDKALSDDYTNLVQRQLNVSGYNFSNTLVEYDSVMNQMLLQYENAGQQEGQTPDTDSQYYRTLKAMALQSHVDRQNAKLKRRIPA